MAGKIVAGMLYGVLFLATGLLLLCFCFFMSFRMLATLFLNGILIYIFIGAFVLYLILEIVKKGPVLSWKKPAALLLVLFGTCAVLGVILVLMLFGASQFSPQSWETNTALRPLMVEDLENRHSILGRTEQEVVSLLGKPENIQEEKGKVFEYLISYGYIDPVIYSVYFQDGIVVGTDISAH